MTALPTHRPLDTGVETRPGNTLKNNERRPR